MRRKSLLIAGGLVGVLILVLIVLVTYAALNLNRIIRDNRAYALAKISDSLGRSVEVRDVRASLGLGVVLDITGLKIADDPRFSQSPMVQVAEVMGRAEFLPLLFGRLHLRRLVFKQPQVRIIRDAQGRLNLSEIGKKPPKESKAAADDPPGDPPSGELAESAPKSSRSSEFLRKIAVNAFTISDGSVTYADLSSGGEPIVVKSINLEVRHFGMTNPFEVAASLAALGEEQDLSVDGSVGPLMRDGAIDPAAIPVELKLKVGPFLLEHLRQLPNLHAAIPRDLRISDAFEVGAKLDGSLNSMKFAMSTDLTYPQVVFGGAFNKAAGVALKIAASGSRNNAAIAIDAANVALAGLDLKTRNLRFAENVMQARVDTNRFDLAPLARVLPAAAKYGLAGGAEVHADVRIVMPRAELASSRVEGGETRYTVRNVGPRLAAKGTVSLSRVGVTPAGGSIPAVGNLDGKIDLTGNGATIEPTSFDLGSAHATLEAKVASFEPLDGTFQFGADDLKLSELAPSRKSDTPEELRRLSVSGTLGGDLSAPRLSVEASSAAGSVSNVDYQNLALKAEYGDQRVAVQSAKLNALGGSIEAAAKVALAEDRSFEATLNLDNVDMEKALASQKAKAAGIVRGFLTGNVQISGSGVKFEDIEPTLRGGGKAAIHDGKLVGVNVAAEALQRTQGIPEVGSIVSPDIIARHPELFSQPDTDIKQAGLTFQIEGPRITTHDLAVQSVDYGMRGDGSFDMDKNIDMQATLVLSRDLSDELEARKKNVAYLANRDGEVEIPLRIVGTLPKPKVQPDVQAMAQTAAQRAVQQQGARVFGKLLGGKGKGGLGRIFGGGSANPGGANPAPANPLGTLKNLFH